jgi:predicted site-specific integrase-resolvase
MTQAMTLDDAATTLGRSVRTIHRWIQDGKLRTEVRDGRTLVLVEARNGEAIAQLQRQADDTARVAALAAVTGERAALAVHARVEELERRVDETKSAMQGWRVVAGITGVSAVLTTVTLAWTLSEARATYATLTDTRKALEASAAARDRLEGAFIAMTLHDAVADSVACDDE